MTSSNPPFVVFPDLNCILRLPSGIEYRGKLREHPAATGEVWYEGYLRALSKEHILSDTNLRDAFNRTGERPAHFHPQSMAEPLHLKLNRIPADKRTEKNADKLVGDVWNHEGLWTVICGPSNSAALLMVGSALPSRHEIEFSGSRIAQYQKVEPTAPQSAAPEAKPETTPAPRKGKGPASRP